MGAKRQMEITENIITIKIYAAVLTMVTYSWPHFYSPKLKRNLLAPHFKRGFGNKECKTFAKLRVVDALFSGYQNAVNVILDDLFLSKSGN